jgi:2-keto-3-deoxy-L-rhamnonate aldolase RhmA
VRRGDVLLGMFLQMGSAVAADIASRAGLDWVLIDLEHGAGTEADLLGQLQAMAGRDVPAVVRVESCVRIRIGRALDLGAAGIMVPQVNTPQVAQELAASLRYPPTGIRGVALSARGAGYGEAGHGDVSAIGDALLGIAQVETATAVSNAAEIAAVDGVDVLFVGPSDLSHSLGVPGSFDSDTYLKAIGQIVEAARSQGKALGVHLPNISAAGRYLELGFTFVSIAGDGGILTAGVRNALQAVRASVSAPANSGHRTSGSEGN